MGPSCAIEQLTCWNSLLSFLLFQSMVQAIECPGSHLFNFLLNLAFKLKRSMNFVVKQRHKMQCNELAFKWTLCCFPYPHIEKAIWEWKPINLNIKMLMSHFSAPLFHCWGSGKVLYYGKLAANSSEVQIFQINKAYVQRCHVSFCIDFSRTQKEKKNLSSPKTVLFVYKF